MQRREFTESCEVDFGWCRDHDDPRDACSFAKIGALSTPCIWISSDVHFDSSSRIQQQELSESRIHAYPHL